LPRRGDHHSRTLRLCQAISRTSLSAVLSWTPISAPLPLKCSLYVISHSAQLNRTCMLVRVLKEKPQHTCTCAHSTHISSWPATQGSWFHLFKGQRKKLCESGAHDECNKQPFESWSYPSVHLRCPILAAIAHKRVARRGEQWKKNTP